MKPLRINIPFIPVILIALIALMLYPLWLGKGSWLKVWDLDRQLKTQKDTNQKLALRNAAVEADVRDLKQGLEAIEERARYDLGMVKADEVFFHIVDAANATPAAVPAQK